MKSAVCNILEFFEKKSFSNGVFVRANVDKDTSEHVEAYTGQLLNMIKIESEDEFIPIDQNDLHCTLIYSKEYFDYKPSDIYPLEVKGPFWLEVLGKDDKVLCICFKNSVMEKRNQELRDQGGVSDFDGYKGHVTILKMVPEDFNPKGLTPYGYSLKFLNESAEPIDDEFSYAK